MGDYIFVNCAFESRELIREILSSLNEAGLEIVIGGGEDKIAGSRFVLNIRTGQARSSKSFHKNLSHALKHEKDLIQIHLDEGGIASDIDAQLDAVLALFKCKYRRQGAPISEEIKESPAPEIPAEDAQTSRPEVVVKFRSKPETSGETDSAPQDREVFEVPVMEVPEPEEIETKESETEKIEIEKIEEIEETETEEKAVELSPPEQGAAPFHEERERLYHEAMDLLKEGAEAADQRKAVSYLIQSANYGYVPAQYQLSICYDEGRGVRRNVREACRWREMAAYGGMVRAQSEMGYCYEYGQGVTRDVREAVRWYRIASEQGDLEAKNNLAFCYQKGRGVQRDSTQAIKLYREAAELGNASAQYNLAYCYWYGEGTSSDKDKAIELFEKSMNGGNAKAAQMIRVLSQYDYLHGANKSEEEE